MAYLILLLLLGAGGITRLTLAQRRRQNEMQTVEGFRTSLEAISQPSRFDHPTAKNRFEDRMTRAALKRRPNAPLDPERREAARRRIEARRSISASTGQHPFGRPPADASPSISASTGEHPFGRPPADASPG